MSEFLIKFLNNSLFGLSLVFVGILIVHAWKCLVWRRKVKNARLTQEEWERMVSLFGKQKRKEDGFLGDIGSYPDSWKKSEVSDGLDDPLDAMNEISEDLKFRQKIWEIEDRQRQEFREAVSKLMRAAGHE